MDLFLGIDVGTSGARAVAVTAFGRLVSEASHPLTSHRAPGVHEQNPEEWWQAVCRSLGALAVDRSRIRSAAVTSTSGSLVVTDADGRPLRPAILYDDARAAGHPTADASWSQAKADWLRRQEPEIWRATRHLLHPADWLAGKLTGNWRLSDSSNCLKLGYDPVGRRWSTGEFEPELLPEVFTPGERAGTVCEVASRETGLAVGLSVAAGATDGIAGLLASGASRPGDGNTTLGTTLVWKLLSEHRPEGSGFYSHLHPAGLWAPGAASNAGPGCLEAGARLDTEAEAFLPARILCYPLNSCGERFPFLNPAALAFRTAEPCCPAELHAAQLQALAFIERWGYERIAASPGMSFPNRIFSTGKAAASPVFTRLRAGVLERPILRASVSSAAFGAAILAASEFHAGVRPAIEQMVQIEETVTPGPPTWRELYAQFRAACAERGYR